MTRFMGELATPLSSRVLGAIVPSETSATARRAAGIGVLDLIRVDRMRVHIDGSKEIDSRVALIKRSGASLTRGKLSTAQGELLCVSSIRRG